jgi:hypothetical protein
MTSSGWTILVWSAYNCHSGYIKEIVEYLKRKGLSDKIKDYVNQKTGPGKMWGVGEETAMHVLHRNKGKSTN